MDSPIIEIENLSFKYSESKKYALKDINIKFNKGEFVCITGSSGSGKSTLALALCGFIPHTIAGNYSGRVLLEKFSIDNLSLTEISQFIGLVQQDPENQLVTPTVLEEIAFGPENLVLSVDEIINRVHSSNKIMGLSALLNRPTNELSGGEKQRVAIAAILSMQPNVIVLDEPTAFLDTLSIKNLFIALKKLNEDINLTIIIIEHQPQLFKDYMNRLIVIEQGRIVGDFNRQEIDVSPYIVPKKILKSIQMKKPKKFVDEVLISKELDVKINENFILRNISTTFKQGMIYGIIGPNGAGKTTFLLTLINLISKHKGKVFLLGENITKKETCLLAKYMGLVFQNPNHQLFEKSVLDETLFAPRNFDLDLQKITTEAKEILFHSSLDQYQEKAPFSLSYGEKRRLTICSMQIYNPKILLLDEPFIGQDRRNIEYLLKILDERKLKGLITIIVSHRELFLFNLVDYLYIFDNGELISQGSPNDLVKSLKDNKLQLFNQELN